MNVLLHGVPGISNILTGFGRLFYIVSPSDTSFSTHQEVPDYVEKSTSYISFCVWIELLVLLLKGGHKGLQKARRSDFSRFSPSDLFNNMASSIFVLTTSLLFYDISLHTYIYIYKYHRIVDLDPHSIWVWVAGFLAADFVYYWFHRGLHEINVFWAAHVVHHSSEYYNLSVALRRSIVQPHIQTFFEMPAALFLPPSTYFVHKQFCLIYQFWLHTEFVGSLGYLEYIFNSPSAHRVHHGRNPYCIDKNYGATLMIWDVLFGTFELERRKEPVVYGLTHPINSFSPVTIQFHHYKHILQTVGSTQGFTNKLKVLFYGPGLHEGTPRTGLYEEIPEIDRDHPPPKYNPPLTTAINFYAIVQTGVMNFLYKIFAALHTNGSNWSTALGIYINIWWLAISVSCIHDHKPWALEIEVIRNVVVMITIVIAPQRQSFPYSLVAVQTISTIFAVFLYQSQRHKYATVTKMYAKTKQQ